MAPKLCAHVTEDIPSAHVKFRSSYKENNDEDKQQSVIWFVTQENISSSKSHTRTCMVYGV